jgi:hypothetical protein
MATEEASNRQSRPRKATSVDVALPLGKSRKGHFDELFAGADDDLDKLIEVIQALREHPDSLAQAKIEEALQTVHLDADVHQRSPELSRFVFLMRELLADYMPGMTLEQMLEPLHTLLSMRGGGRPSDAATHDRWLAEYEARQRANRLKLSAQDIYEDMAEQENSLRAKAGRESIGWRQIRDGCSKARKNPV